MTGALIVPCSLATARAWCHGWIGDFELLKCGGTGAVYFSTLPDLASFRAALPEFIAHYRRGVRVVILRTNHPAVIHHVTRFGAQATFQDASGRFRWLCGPDVVNRYFGRLVRKTDALKSPLARFDSAEG
jgi:hypothetical protein